MPDATRIVIGLSIMTFATWLAFIEDTFLGIVVLAMITFAIIRVARSPRFLGRKSRFYSSHMWQAYMILVMIFLVVSTVLMARASRAALHTLPYNQYGAYLSYWVAHALKGWSTSSLEWLEDGMLLAHLAVVFSFLV